MPRPSLVVISGQSNATGILPTPLTTSMPINTDIKSWETINGTRSTGSCEFVTADPKRAISGFDGLLLIGVPGQYETAGPTFGFPIGHFGWAAANFAQEQQQNQIYLVSITKPTASIVDWADGAEVEARLALEMPLALAAIESETGYALDGPDLMIWMQGESNAGLFYPDFYMTPTQYAAALTTFKTLAETKWSVLGHTKWAICDFSPEFKSLYVAPSWNGLQLFVAGQGDDAEFISSIGTFSPDDAHYDGDSSNEMGKRTAYSRYRSLVL